MFIRVLRRAVFAEYYGLHHVFQRNTCASRKTSAIAKANNIRASRVLERCLHGSFERRICGSGCHWFCSVFMQTLFFTSRVGIGMKHFFFSKLICGFTSALTALLYFHFFPMEGCAKDVFYSVSSLNDVISAIFVPTILYISCIFVSKINKFCVKS